MINLASREDNEQAFWTGLINGWGFPGLHPAVFVDPPAEWGYDEDLSIYDTSIVGENPDVQDSYNLGLITSTFAWTSLVGGFGYMVGAEVGAVSALLIWASPITAIAVPGVVAASFIAGTRQPGETSTDFYARGGIEKSSGTTSSDSWWPSWLFGDLSTPEYNS